MFYDSRWTQQKLADEEGKSQGYTDKCLRFGRFLSRANLSNNSSGIIPKNLTDRRFRSYWEQTSGTKDTARFRSVRQWRFVTKTTSFMRRLAGPGRGAVTWL